jgi:hypothetical protein
MFKIYDEDTDPGSGICCPGSGMEKFGNGIRDKHPGSATYIALYYILKNSYQIPCIRGTISITNTGDISQSQVPHQTVVHPYFHGKNPFYLVRRGGSLFQLQSFLLFLVVNFVFLI